MGGCLFKGDLLLKNLKKKAIILMGNTRIGKSTLYNHFLNIPMKGVQGPRGVILAVIP
jgi:putative ribosome biogenesis GTPase RsgA